MQDYTTAYIRKEIKMHKENQVAQARLEAQIRRDGNIAENKKAQLLLLRERNVIVEGWMSILSEDEAYVVQRHLIDGITWPRVEVEYSEKWKEFGKCQRTLMRYQDNALKKIQRFMNEQEDLRSIV